MMSTSKNKSLFERSLLTDTVLMLLVAGMLIGLGWAVPHLLEKYRSWITQSLGQTATSQPEIKDIIKEAEAGSDYKPQATAYLKLIKRIGPEAAQEALQHSGLPYSPETHLINHTAGEYLYRTYGNKGLVYCKNYFLSSCYHGFVLNIIGGGVGQKVGDQATVTKNLKEVIDYCEQQSDQILVQCAHAIGHGVLAYFDYKDLIGALKYCDEAHSSVPKLSPVDCYDGVFMENIFGVHDGAPSPDRWIKADDLRYPCDDPRIDAKYLEGCWRNQPSIMWQAVGENPRLVSDFCEGLNNQYTQLCMHGVSQLIQSNSKGDGDKMIAACRTLNAKWQDYCLYTNATVGFSFGDRALLYKLCPLITDNKNRIICLSSGPHIITSFIKDPVAQVQACNTLPVRWRFNCLLTVKNPHRLSLVVYNQQRK